VTNAEPTSEDFESLGLGVERVVPGRATAAFSTRPMRPIAATNVIVKTDAQEK
jgi:hypothetical protein